MVWNKVNVSSCNIVWLFLLIIYRQNYWRGMWCEAYVYWTTRLCWWYSNTKPRYNWSKKYFYIRQNWEMIRYHSNLRNQFKKTNLKRFRHIALNGFRILWDSSAKRPKKVDVQDVSVQTEQYIASVNELHAQFANVPMQIKARLSQTYGTS